MAMGTVYSKQQYIYIYINIYIYIYIYIYIVMFICLYIVFHMLGVIYLGCVNLCLNLYSGTDAIFLNLLLFPVRL